MRAASAGERVEEVKGGVARVGLVMAAARAKAAASREAVAAVRAPVATARGAVRWGVGVGATTVVVGMGVAAG